MTPTTQTEAKTDATAKLIDWLEDRSLIKHAASKLAADQNERIAAGGQHTAFCQVLEYVKTHQRSEAKPPVTTTEEHSILPESVVNESLPASDGPLHQSPTPTPEAEWPNVEEMIAAYTVGWPQLNWVNQENKDKHRKAIEAVRNAMIAVSDSWKSRAERAEAARDRLAESLSSVAHELVSVKKERDQHAETIKRLEESLTRIKAQSVDSESLRGMKIEYHEDDNRFYAYAEDGKFLWSGQATFNVWMCVKQEAEITRLRAALESEAMLHAKTHGAANEQLTALRADLERAEQLGNMHSQDFQRTLKIAEGLKKKLDEAQRPASPWVLYSERGPSAADVKSNSDLLLYWHQGRFVWNTWNYDWKNTVKPTHWLKPEPPALPSAQPAQATDLCPTCRSGLRAHRCMTGTGGINQCADPWHASAQPDPLAEVKAAYVKGKATQWRWKNRDGMNEPGWADILTRYAADFDNTEKEFRVKPDDLPKPWVARFKVGDRVRIVKVGFNPAWHGEANVEEIAPPTESEGAQYKIATFGWFYERQLEFATEPHVEPSPAQKMERKVITSHVHPPIPLRQFDWCAHYDGDEEGLKGWGRTEAAAIQDLKDITP